MNNYSDKHGNFFGRLNEDGDVDVLHAEDGADATIMDCRGVYPVGSDGSQSVRYEHADGIVISRADANRIGLRIE